MSALRALRCMLWHSGALRSHHGESETWETTERPNGVLLSVRTSRTCSDCGRELRDWERRP